MTADSSAVEEPAVEDRDALLVEHAERFASTQFPLRRFPRFSQIEQYVAAVLLTRWWSETFPDAPLEVVVLRRSRTATFSAATITGRTPTPSATGAGGDGLGVIWLVDGRGWGLETVLHEMAHLAAGIGAGHGVAFRSALGHLWRHEAGIEAWAALQAGLSSYGPPGGAPHDESPRPQPHP